METQGCGTRPDWERGDGLGNFNHKLSGVGRRHWRRVSTGVAAAGMAGLLAAASWGGVVLPGSGPVAAERLIIQYRAGRFEVLTRAPLTKVLPASEELSEATNGVSGFWFELQTAQGEVRYRRLMPNPLVIYTEVPDPRQAPLPARSEALASEAVFSVLIPQVPGSNNLMLVSSPLDAASKTQAAQTLARIPLAEPSK